MVGSERRFSVKLYIPSKIVKLCFILQAAVVVVDRPFSQSRAIVVVSRSKLARDDF